MTQTQTMEGTRKARLIRAAGATLFVFFLFFCTAVPAAAPPGELTSYEFVAPSDAETETAQGITSLEVSEDFSCDTNGRPQGELFINPQCAATGVLGIFANVVCRIENLFGNVLALMYCAVQVAIVPPLLALMTLYVVIYGAMVILGMVPHRLSEALKRVAKIGLVGAIALNADIAIKVAYSFYISAAQTTISAIFSVFDTDFTETHPTYEQLVEGGYTLSPGYSDPERRLYTGEHWMQGFDHVFNAMVQTLIDASPILIPTLVIMFFVMFPVFCAVIQLIISIFKAIAEAIISYLIALLMITLLFCLAPIFVSFALFRFTAGWFETWLKYLASFTLQMMIVFAFIMIMIMVDIFSFLAQTGELIRTYMHHGNFGFIHWVRPVVTLCEPVREGDDMRSGEIVYYKFHTSGPGPDGSHLSDDISDAGAYGGFPKCIPEYDPKAIWERTASHWPPNMTSETVRRIREEMPFLSDSEKQDLVYERVDDANRKLAIPFLKLIQTTDLLGFLLVRLLVVIILTWLFEKFLRIVPDLASHLAGTQHAGRLGGGDLEGADMMSKDPSNLATGFETFRASATKDGNRWRGSPTGALRGIGAGMVQAGRRAAVHTRTKAARGGISTHVRQELGTPFEIWKQSKEGVFGDSKEELRKAPGITRGGRATRGGEGKKPPTGRATRRGN